MERLNLSADSGESERIRHNSANYHRPRISFHSIRATTVIPAKPARRSVYRGGNAIEDRRGAAPVLVTFSCAAKRKSPKRRPPRSPSLIVASWDPLRCSPGPAAAQLAQNAQTVLAANVVASPCIDATPIFFADLRPNRAWLRLLGGSPGPAPKHRRKITRCRANEPMSSRPREAMRSHGFIGGGNPCGGSVLWRHTIRLEWIHPSGKEKTRRGCRRVGCGRENL